MRAQSGEYRMQGNIPGSARAFAIANDLSMRQARKVLQGRKTLESAKDFCDNGAKIPTARYYVDPRLRPCIGKTGRKWSRKV